MGQPALQRDPVFTRKGQDSRGEDRGGGGKRRRKRQKPLFVGQNLKTNQPGRGGGRESMILYPHAWKTGKRKGQQKKKGKESKPMD